MVFFRSNSYTNAALIYKTQNSKTITDENAIQMAKRHLNPHTTTNNNNKKNKTKWEKLMKNEIWSESSSSFNLQMTSKLQRWVQPKKISCRFWKYLFVCVHVTFLKEYNTIRFVCGRNCSNFKNTFDILICGAGNKTIIRIKIIRWRCVLCGKMLFFPFRMHNYRIIHKTI